MSLLTDLQQIVNDNQTQDQARADIYLEAQGYNSIAAFFKREAAMGKTGARLHLEKGPNPKHRQSGFATLSGQLAIANAEAITGIFVRNEIGWVYLNMPSVTIQQFHAKIDDMVTELTTEGLAVTETRYGAEIGELTLSWE